LSFTKFKEITREPASPVMNLQRLTREEYVIIIIFQSLSQNRSCFFSVVPPGANCKACTGVGLAPPRRRPVLCGPYSTGLTGHWHSKGMTAIIYTYIMAYLLYLLYITIIMMILRRRKGQVIE
jgi:hypothetical protein